MTHKNLTAIVTGAARGIGLGIAQRLAEQGANVVLADINFETAKQEAACMTARGMSCMAFKVNVSCVEDLKAMVNSAVTNFGGLDILVNNAGILDSSPILEMTEEHWDRVMAVNLKSVFFASQTAIPHLKESSSPRIVNISSLAGRMGGYETGLSYSASKGGIISLTMGMARQLAPFGITVNSVCPGTTESEIIKDWSAEQIAGLVGKIPLGRLGSVKDIATAAAFLTGRDAGFITGLLLDVNGGMYMG